jgi:hypothetical protein
MEQGTEEYLGYKERGRTGDERKLRNEIFKI